MTHALQLRQLKSALSAGALESLADHLAILDRAGTILVVNDAWNSFGTANGASDVGAIGPGVNYLDVCAKAALAGVPGAAYTLEGLADVCSGHRAEFEIEYPCNGPLASRVFLMKATPLRHQRGGAVVSHRDITAWKLETRTPRRRGMLKVESVSTRRLRARAREEERRRIGRELHDDVSQRLALLAIGIEQVKGLAHDKTIGARLHDLWVATTRISHGVHNLSRRLHASPHRAFGLVHSIRRLTREVSAQGLRVIVIDDATCGEVPEAIALCLFRVTQEALSNVLQHSGMREATVTLKSAGQSLLLRVEDRGRGFDSRVQNGGVGLRSMRERLMLVGGELMIRARPGEGTIVEARVSREARSPAASVSPPTYAA